MRGDGTLLFTPRQVFLPLAGSCAGGIAVILLLARDREVAYAAATAFGFATLISLLLATVWSRPGTRSRTRVIAVGALGASAALPGWYFGPSSAYAGIVASLLLFAGVVLGGRDTAFPIGGAWAVAVGLIGGQATVAALIFAGVLRDASLLPLVPRGEAWHHVAAHVTVLAVHVAAFAIGRRLHQRYWQLSEDLEAATREVAHREALLDEARAEYRRCFALGKEGVFAGHTLGRYQLGELLGRGGAGEVYAARDLVDGSRAAVKLLRADRLGDEAQLRGFLAEATLLTGLDAPNIVRTKQVGGLEAPLPYLAMEHLAGETLAQRVAARGRLDRDELRALIDGGCRALAAIHQAGVIHGDVAPANLVLDGAIWKLIDFGARAGEGSPRFVAPERLAGEAPSVASDLYGLAACVYLAITGEPPFASVRAAALPGIVARELPLDPRLAAEISHELADALACALAPDPVARWASADELQRALRGEGTPASPPAWSVAPFASTPEDTAAHTELLASAPPAPVPLPWLDAPTATEVDSVAHWRGAFAERMQLQYVYILAACAVGVGLLAAIAPAPWLLGVGLASIAAAALVVALEQRTPREWPWTVVATLAIGPGYVLGLHSGFAAVLVVVLFIESSFTTASSRFTGRGYTLAAVLLTHGACFALIELGVLPDAGVTPTLGIAVELLVLGVFVTAFAMGRITQQRYAELVRRTELAARQAAHQQALLATARAEVERVLAGFAGGLFTGTTLGGYRVGRLLGRGGMGEVYAATRDGEDVEEVALKIIRADRVAGAVLRRFEREAQALTRVASPYVARVIEIGTEDDRLPFMAMELVHGSSLAELLRERERLEPDELRALIRDAARGLADVHRAGVIHRDVKPHNLLRTAGAWKLVDFGIAVIEDAPRATTGNVLVGTPAYMAPEQLTGDAIDTRTDLYAFCLVLYRVLLGRPAFTHQRVSDPGAAPADPYASDLPRALCQALAVGLARDPAARYQTAGELEAAFLRALDR